MYASTFLSLTIINTPGLIAVFLINCIALRPVNSSEQSFTSESN